MKQRLEPVVVHDAAGAADLRRDAVGALLDPAGRFGIDRGTVANPLHDGVQVCQDLRVDAGGFGFGGAHTGIVRGMASLIFRTPGCDARQFSAGFHSRG